MRQNNPFTWYRSFPYLIAIYKSSLKVPIEYFGIFLIGWGGEEEEVGGVRLSRVFINCPKVLAVY